MVIIARFISRVIFFGLFLLLLESESCIIWENTRIKRNSVDNSTNLMFNVRTTNRKEYLGISFLNSNEPLTINSSSTFYFFKFPNLIFKMNKTKRELIPISDSFFMIDNFDNTIDGSFDFAFKLSKNDKNLKNQSYINFIKYPGDIPLNFEEIITKQLYIGVVKLNVLKDSKNKFFFFKPIKKLDFLVLDVF